MSLLKTIKGTFSTVQKDISKGLKSLNVADSQKVSSKLLKAGVHVKAGVELLNSYENCWADIHKSIEDSAKQSKVVENEITEISQFYDKQREALTLFQSEVSSLPQLTESFSGLVTQLVTLEQDVLTIENMLLALEDVCEQQELITNKHRHHAQLEVYKQQKNIEVEQAKVDLAKKHAKDVQTYESNIQETLREKQKVFEETYEQEIEKYKQSGEVSIKSASVGSASTGSLDLADISVEEDASELEKFLEADQDDVVHSDQQPKQEITDEVDEPDEKMQDTPQADISTE